MMPTKILLIHAAGDDGAGDGDGDDDDEDDEDDDDDGVDVGVDVAMQLAGFFYVDDDRVEPLNPH